MQCLAISGRFLRLLIAKRILGLRGCLVFNARIRLQIGTRKKLGKKFKKVKKRVDK